MNKMPAGSGTPSELITKRIAALEDWRGKTLSTMRKLIKEADPDVVEEWKWNIPVWSHDGIICTGETYKSTVKLTFAKGAALQPVPPGASKHKLVRYLAIREDDDIDEAQLKAGVKQASELPGEMM